MEKITDDKKKPTRNTKPMRILAGLVAVVLIFLIGVNVGNGRISLGKGNDTTQLPGKLDYSSVNEVYDVLKANYYQKLTQEQILDGIKKGVAQSTGDPYTQYFTAKEAKAFNNELNNSYSGIGAQLGKDDDGNLEVIAPVKGTPAEKAGLLPKDIVTSINGQTTDGLGVDTAVNKIRGEAGTKVKLGIVRNKSEALNLEITRENFTVPSVETKTLDNGIGLITITSFAPDTAELATKAAMQFQNQNIRKVILDLRDNPGGEVNAATGVASLWLPQGKRIMQEKRGDTVLQDYQASGTATLQDVPTVVLVNDGSASASEIVAGALHDNKAATIIGQKTYGKGVVQGLENLRDGAQLKVTIASWYRPNGQNINKKGIDPDQKVDRTPDDAKAGKDPQMDAATTFLNK